MPVDAVPPPDPSRTDTAHRFGPTVRRGAPLPPAIAANGTAITPSLAGIVDAACRPRIALAPALTPTTTAVPAAVGVPTATDVAHLVARRLAGCEVTPQMVRDTCRVAVALVDHLRHTARPTRVTLEVSHDHGEVEVDASYGVGPDGARDDIRPDRPDLSDVETLVRAVVAPAVTVRAGRSRGPSGGRVWVVLGTAGTIREPASTATADLLLGLATALAQATTPADVAAATAGVLGAGLGALGVRFSVVERDRHHLVSLAQAWPGGLDTAPRRDPLDDRHASSRVARSGRPLYLSGRDEIVRGLPALAADASAAAVEAVAAVPLLVDGDTTGVIAVVWDRARDLDHDERGVLTAVATFAAAALHRTTLAQEHRATAEILQATLLPQQLPELPGVDVTTVYRPVGYAPDVGGDWYDAFVLPGGNLYLVIGDVAGHGTTAARTMGKIRYSARAYAVAGAGPAEVLARTNALLRHHGRDLLASMLCVEYDPVTRTAVVADAGHMPALVVPERGPARFLEGPVGPMLGATDDAVYAASAHVLAPGETVLLYTDGLVERRDRAIDDCLADLAGAATEMRRFRAASAPLAVGLADRRAASDVVTDDVCVLAVTHR